MIHTGCKGCKDRYLGCHSHCQKYYDYKAELGMIHKKQAEEYALRCVEITRNLKKKKWGNPQNTKNV